MDERERLVVLGAVIGGIIVFVLFMLRRWRLETEAKRIMERWLHHG